jgi:hypothetical protein
MKRVEEDGDWSIMCPAECPGDLSERYTPLPAFHFHDVYILELDL